MPAAPGGVPCAKVETGLNFIRQGRRDGTGSPARIVPGCRYPVAGAFAAARFDRTGGPDRGAWAPSRVAPDRTGGSIVLARRARRCERRTEWLGRRKSLVTRSDRSFVLAADAPERLFHLCHIFGEVCVLRFAREALRERVNLERRDGCAPCLAIDGETETVGCRSKGVASACNSIWHSITPRTASRSILSRAWNVEEASTAAVAVRMRRN